MKDKVAIYCRISTQMQSTDRQEEELLKYAEQNNYKVEDVYVDVVTDAGIVSVVRLEQLSNALLPMVVTESEIVNKVRLEQPQYLQPIITQYFIDNKSEIWLLFLIAHSKR